MRTLLCHIILGNLSNRNQSSTTQGYVDVSVDSENAWDMMKGCHTG